jgi:hypothetical protein
MLTSTTPSIFLLSVATCDAQELHISAEISNEISSTSVAAGPAAGPPVAGAPQLTRAAASNRKGAKRTNVIVRLAPRVAGR